MNRYRTPLICLALTLAACEDDKPQPPAQAAAAASEAVPAPPPEAKAKAKANAATSPRQCGSVAQHFPYDSDFPLADGRAEFEQLTSCLRQSLGEGQSITLVGRADDRGSESYNYWLGMRRAQRIRGLLLAEGLSAGQVKLRSVGERGAIGHTPEHSRAEDRRVDVVYPSDAI